MRDFIKKFIATVGIIVLSFGFFIPQAFATDATITYLQTAGDTSELTTYTYSTQNFGTATSDRRIIAAITARDIAGGANSISSVTIGGVAATIAVQQYTTGNVSGIAIAAVPTGTSGDVVVVYASQMGNSDIGLFSTTGVGSNTASDTGTSAANPGTYALDVVAGGVAVAIASADVESANMNTWAGLTERWDAQQSSSNNFTGSSAAFSTTQTNLTVSVTRSSSSRPTYAVASFPPVLTSLKNKDGLAEASIKTFNGTANASIKSTNGLQ